MKLTREVETCCVVDQFCLSPANLETPIPAKGRCYRCGQAVCSKCSLRVMYKGERRRLCHDCIVEEDDGDARVMRHLWMLAGYPKKGKAR